MIRWANEDDITPLNHLFKTVFDKKRDAKTVQWKYFEHPVADNPWVLVFEDGYHILGSISLWVNDAYVEGLERKIALRCDTMVHPDSRGRGIYRQLNERMLQEAEARNIDLLYGFPSDKAKGPLIAQTNAQDLGGVQRYIWLQKPITLLADKFKPFKFLKPYEAMYQKRKRRQLEASPNHIREINAFDERADRLMDQVKKIKPVVTKRTANYLNWRYADHPTNNYRKFVYERNGEWLGYVVVSERSIVDIIATDEPAIWDALINQTLLSLHDAPFIQTWTMPDNPLEAALKRANFTKKDEPMPFVVNQFDDTNQIQREDVYLVQGDVDSF
ncbi:putative N-acetyltransferase YhbS [Alkalibacillus flavidus]|uniref:N-acetyltransferase YhbS n=1 Tax=Alkalibacillus flavidus TaxID=546021 RepID=A0ABV2KXB7_9BACI